MMRGLVIGKFLPVHEGHIALIRFAASQCDELIVSMSYTAHDAIDPSLRFGWMKEIFRYDVRIRCFLVKDDFDDESLEFVARTKVWADFLRGIYPPIDAVFSSEDYGAPLATHLHAKHIMFDVERNQFPVSASLIRNNPFQYWNFIPPQVRPYFVKKICFYGPESTGKSFMSEKLAKRYHTDFVPEVARELIISNNFTEDDIVRIGYAQTERVLQKTQTANKILFCDTDVITTQIYSEHYLNVVPEILFELEKSIHYDAYFLFHPDVTWVKDHMRNLGDRRQEMFAIFRSALDERKIPYTEVKGTYEARENIIVKKIEETFKL